MPQRIKHIDLAAGIMILWMVFTYVYSTFVGYEGESNSASMHICVQFPYLSFFMPWFFYKSGQFFQKHTIKDQFTRDAHKLLKNFIIWSFVGYGLFLLLNGIIGNLTLHSATYSMVRSLFLNGCVPLNIPLWFLFSLFLAHTIANILLPSRNSMYYNWRCAMVVIIFFVVAYLCYRYNNPLLPRWIANTSAGVCFFTLGYWMFEYENKWWLITPCVVGYVLCVWFGFTIVDMYPNELLNGIYLLWIPTSTCGIVVFNTFCRGVSSMEDKLSAPSFLCLFGKYAMWILVTHNLIIQIVYSIQKQIALI